MSGLFARILGRSDPAPKTAYAVEITEGEGAWLFDTDREHELAKFRRIIEEGGVVSQGIEAYSDTAFGNGYTWDPQNESAAAKAKKVEADLAQTDLETLDRLMGIDALGLGYAVAEKVKTLNGTFHSLVWRPAESFLITRDIYGRITSICQKFTVNGSPTENQNIPLNSLFIFDPKMHILKMAYDDIVRDTKSIDGAAQALYRNGYPRSHWKLGQPGEIILQDTIKAFGRANKKVKPGQALTTNSDVNHALIDTGNISSIAITVQVFMDRLAAAMGVPSEFFSSKSGGLESAGPASRARQFMIKCSMFQRTYERQFNLQITDELVGGPGLVKRVFNDVSPENETEKAKYVQILTSLDQMNPWSVITPEEARAYLGFAPMKVEGVDKDGNV